MKPAPATHPATRSSQPPTAGATVPADAPGIRNPFVRFHTRSHWLAAMIKQGRQADPTAVDAPDWFNR